MIILKTKKINTFSLKTKKNFNLTKKICILQGNIDEYEDTYNYGYLECPHCKSDDLIYYGSYIRNVGFCGVFKTLRIKRVLCKHCGKTHAIIPTFIKSYFQYESSFIDFVLFLIEIKKIKSKQIKNILNLSRQLFEKWRKRYLEHKMKLITTYNNIPIRDIFNLMFYDSFISNYFKYNRIYYFDRSTNITFS